MIRSNHRPLHYLLATLLALARSGPAIADDVAAHDVAGANTGNLAATIPSETGTSATAATTTTVTAAATAPEPESRYPRAVIARPLTLPQGLGVLGADALANHDFSAMAGAPIVGYGFTDDLEIQVPYAFATKDFEIKGAVNGDLGYKLLRGAAGGKLEAIARVRAGYDLLASAATPLMVGVHVQYNLTDTLAVISGTPGSQQLRISLADSAAKTRPIDLSLPVGLGYQATGQLYLQLDTKLVQLDLSDSANVWFGADATPLALTVVYNVLPALDVQGVVSTDLSNTPGDALSFLVGARYYAGRL